MIRISLSMHSYDCSNAAVRFAINENHINSFGCRVHCPSSNNVTKNMSDRYNSTALTNGPLFRAAALLASAMTFSDPELPTNAISARVSPGRIGFDYRRDRSRIVASGNHAGRCHWSAGFRGNLPFLLPLNSGVAQTALNIEVLRVDISSQDLVVKNLPNLSTQLSTPLNAASPIQITATDNSLLSGLTLSVEFLQTKTNSSRSLAMREGESDSEDISDTEDNVDVQSVCEDEQSASEESDNECDARGNIITGKNGHRWTLDPPSTHGRTPARNIIRLPHGKIPTGASEDCLELLVTSEMIKTVVHYTNDKIKRQSQKYPDEAEYVGDISDSEIYALIRLLYFVGSRKDSHLRTDEMWSESFGCHFYRAVIFDDKSTRSKEDKFPPIRQLWESLIKNFTSRYTPLEYCTIDEQLLGFRGKYPFRVYMASKPDRYDLKIITFCDSKTYHMVNAIPLTGKEANRKESLPITYVRDLSVSIHGTGRNSTFYNRFMSVADLPWRSRLVCHLSGVREALGLNPG
ncbi:hypothetical protein PR048_015096 [Dryococelus australis]|uniref:PiggyBac transposable element-derived protein domain-containing protein n=1 Tax=Dryococelus australis TaxID=614101 RepID=A0ABQ9HG86_9NEOP|nr:hypothetical protein PR048_015096 [Dryococelus australis]